MEFVCNIEFDCPVDFFFFFPFTFDFLFLSFYLGFSLLPLSPSLAVWLSDDFLLQITGVNCERPGSRRWRKNSWNRKKEWKRQKKDNCKREEISQDSERKEKIKYLEFSSLDLFMTPTFSSYSLLLSLFSFLLSIFYQFIYLSSSEREEERDHNLSWHD